MDEQAADVEDEDRHEAEDEARRRQLRADYDAAVAGEF